MKDPVTVTMLIQQPVHKVWDYFYNPKHIVKWNFPTTNWHCPSAESDFREGGRFNYRMEYKDASFGYNFSGLIDEIKVLEFVKSHLNNGRKIEVRFNKIDEKTTEITVIFEPDLQTSIEMQRVSWFAILVRFRKYVDNN